MMRWLSTIKRADEGEIEVERMELDEAGFPQPTGELEHLGADSVVLALGQESDLGLVEGVAGIEVEDSIVRVGADMMTGHPGIFAGGDMVPAERTVTVAIGHGKRAARHIASKTDVEQAYAVGKAAVQLALKGRNSVMPTIERKPGTKYKWSIGEAPLDKVANVEKKMPRDYISKDGFHITAKCRDYLAPLIAGEDYPPYKNGLPVYAQLKKVFVEKKLKEGFSV